MRRCLVFLALFGSSAGVFLHTFITGEDVLCASHATSITPSVYIDNLAALNARIGGSGSASFDFGDKSGFLWAKTRCQSGTSDSWIVNGVVWHIPHSSSFEWHMFGIPPDDGVPGTTIINLASRESNCQIQALYLGDSGDLLERSQLSESCDNTAKRGYQTPHEMSLTFPVVYESGHIHSILGTPNAGGGSATLQFSRTAPFSSFDKLWLHTQCPDGDSDTWFVDGDLFEIPHSNTFEWHEYGAVSSTDGSIVLTPRQINCRIDAAYYGADTPSSGFMLDDGPQDSTQCTREADITGNVEFGHDMYEISGSCAASMSNPSFCSGSASFDFGSNRAPVWAFTRCSGGSSDSWYVNGAVWHVPHSTDFAWHEFGNVDADVVTFAVREPDCEIAQVFRGFEAPSEKVCFAPGEGSLVTQCQQGVNCFHGHCSEDLSFCECNFYAYGCECHAFSGEKPTVETCGFDYDITSATYKLSKPKNATHDQRGVVLYYTVPRTLYRVTVDSIDQEVTAQETCKEGFVYANGIAIDISQGVFVADSQASKLQYVWPNCGSTKEILGITHFIASPGDVEILTNYGVLIVASWARHGIFYVEVDSNYNVVRYANTGATGQLAHGLTECSDSFGNDGFLFVERGNHLVFFDVVKREKTVILGEASGVVDITDIQWRRCGLFFTANDNNQMWMCREGPSVLPQSCKPSGLSCRRLCDPLVDSSSCEYLVNPSGIATDCECNVYVGNRGIGNLVMYQAGAPHDDAYRNGEVLVQDAYTNDVEVFGPCECQTDFDPPHAVICAESNNAQDSTNAGEGDTVTVNITADEFITKPTVTCSINGNQIGVVVTPDELPPTLQYQATFTVDSNTPIGPVVCTLGQFADYYGNDGTSSTNQDPSCNVEVGATASPTPSMTPTRTPTPSQSPTPSVTPTPSRTPTPSTSPSPSPSFDDPSTSPTPSPSSPVKLQVEKFFESGECSTEGCVNLDPRDNVTIRMSTRVSRVEPFEFSGANVGACSGEGGTPTPDTQTVWQCVIAQDWDDLTNWAIGDFNLYRLISNGFPPPFLEGPVKAGPGVYPNTVSATSNIEVIAAAVDCTGLPSAAPLRWVENRPTDGPCLFDQEYQITICSAPGKANNNANYQDVNGGILADDSIFKDVFCPT